MAFALKKICSLSKQTSFNFERTLVPCLVTKSIAVVWLLPFSRSLFSSRFKVKKTQKRSTGRDNISSMASEAKSAMGERRPSKSRSDNPRISPYHSKHKILWPPARKGMTKLETSAFDKNISIPTVIIYEDQMQPDILRQLKPFLLKIQGIKPIQENENSQSTENENNHDRKTKKVYLDPDLVGKRDFSDFMRQEIKLDSKVISSISKETVKFSYNNWTWNQIFDAVLPDDQEKIASFSHIGHIIHLNLRDHLLPYKHVIGNVFLDKISHAKTVVNKLSNIDNTFRNFQMEILAGDQETVVHLKENRCEFTFDFAHVYWNPRLSAEHERVFKLVQVGDVLYDVFAGVGPFTIPVAKKKCTVLANDLNPESYKWLQHNVKKNKVDNYVRCFNQDGRDFITEPLANDLTNWLKKSEDPDKPEAFDFVNKKFHVTMNLPSLAPEFLDAFWGILKVVDSNLINPKLTVIVHVYCFIKDTEGFKVKAVQLVEEKLKIKLPKKDVLEVIMVRNVAPNKEMLRVSFILPHSVMINSIDHISLKRKHIE